MKRLLPKVIRRRGSVLILCVVLIVVLALIGTAMLSRARMDRGTTVQNTNNTEVDLLNGRCPKGRPDRDHQ
jgi:Tfp pilus assembly protein PilX